MARNCAVSTPGRSMGLPVKANLVMFNPSALDNLDVERAERERLSVMWALETAAWAEGFRRVAGVDEAGRGPLAGPIVAAAVCLSCPVPGLNDSKQLSAERREELFTRLMDGPHDVGIGTVAPSDIDRMGIQQANYLAMRMAVEALARPPDLLLVDGYALPGMAMAVRRVIRGDRLSLSIAAASIVAKVTRDRHMRALDARYPQYGFARHKGYGVPEHLDAIARFGPCPEHRRSFAPLRGNGPLQQNLFTRP